MKMGPETKALVPAEMVQRVKEFNAEIQRIGDYEYDPTRPKPKEKKEETTQGS
jgi:hypothetical protein